MLHRPVHDDDLEEPALPADDQPAGRLDHICLGRELSRHRSSGHWLAGYRRATAQPRQSRSGKCDEDPQ